MQDNTPRYVPQAIMTIRGIRPVSGVVSYPPNTAPNIAPAGLFAAQSKLIGQTNFTPPHSLGFGRGFRASRLPRNSPATKCNTPRVLPLTFWIGNQVLERVSWPGC